MLRCPNCKEKVVRFPLKDSNGKLIVKNLFKMDLMSLIGFIVIIFLVTAYKADTETCREIISDPLKYCKESNACKVIEERENPEENMNTHGMVDINEILDLIRVDDFNNSR
ncbi:hypothetical protein LCGC14_0862880 [marine sediment metagenome]|uniref:Uncharacterized protein n=1 Tax=marine sediment metagenome TaxID=412755 RepID=A0A0F9RRH5_9ZZZZ